MIDWRSVLRRRKVGDLFPACAARVADVAAAALRAEVAGFGAAVLDESVFRAGAVLVGEIGRFWSVLGGESGRFCCSLGVVVGFWA